MNIVKRIITLPIRPHADLAGWERVAVFPVVLAEIFLVGWIAYHALVGIVSGIRSL